MHGAMTPVSMQNAVLAQTAQRCRPRRAFPVAGTCRVRSILCALLARSARSAALAGVRDALALVSSVLTRTACAATVPAAAASKPAPESSACAQSPDAPLVRTLAHV